MNDEQSQPSSVVLAVVVFLGAVAVLGLAGMIWLVHAGTDPAAIALIGGPEGVAIGALAGILASTRSAPSAPVQAQQAVGYQQAVADVAALAAPAEPAPAAPSPSLVAPPLTG